MTPLYLKFSGIFSYQNPVEIDFQKLSQQGIFGIFGSVGSGKSAIIDAMTFVLYGDYHRSPNKNVPYNLMNLKSNESLIEFRFEHKDKMYEFHYHAKRNSNNFQNISKTSRKAYSIDNGQLIPLESNNAAKILDLDFEEFIKLVIIPQGQFAEFINLTDGNRTKMLKKILKLDQYSLYNPTSSLYHKAKEEHAYLEGQLNNYVDIHPEKLASLQQQITQLESNLKDNLLKYNTLKSAIEASEHLYTQQQRLEQVNLELQNLQSQDKDIQLIEQQLKTQELVQSQFRDIYIKRQEYEQISNNFQQRILELERQKNTISDEIAKISEEIHHKIQPHAQIQDLDNFINKYIKYNELNNLTQLKTEIELQLNQQKELIEQYQLAFNIKTKELDDLDNSIQFINNQINKESELKQLERQFQDLESLQSQITTLNATIEDYQLRINDLSTLKAQLITQLNTQYQTNISTESKVNESIILLQQEAQKYTALHKSLTEKLEQNKNSSVLHQFATQLETQRPCPLCGSTEHPYPYSNEKANEEYTQLTHELNTITQLINAIQICIKDLENLINIFKLSTQESQKLIQQRESLNKQYQTLINITKDIDYNNIKSELNQISKLKTDLQYQLQRKATLQKKLQDVQVSISKIDIKSTEIAMAQIDTNIQNIQSLHCFSSEDITLFQSKSIESLQENLDWCLTQQKILDNYNNKLNNISLELDNTNIQNTLVKDKLHTLQESWLNKLDQFQIDEKEIIQFIENPLDSNVSLHKILTHNNLKNKLLEELSELRSINLDNKINIEELNIQKSHSITLENSIKEIDLQINILKNEVNKIHKQLEEKNKLLHQAEKIEARVHNLNTLLQLFRGDRFVQYISKQYTQHLFLLANKRFKKLTFNQLELSIDEDNNFSIIDYLNEKRPRSIKTLSGGQLFQASLCLALALSEQLQIIQNHKQQFFFIDEGFGTLDKESLEIVMQTLRELKSEGRTVGVISHVEDMKDNIDYNIFVEKDPEKGSFILKSY